MTIDVKLQKLDRQRGELENTFAELKEKQAWIGMRRSWPEQAIIAVVTLIQDAYTERTPESISEAEIAVETVRGIYDQFGANEYSEPLSKTKQFVDSYLDKHPNSRLAIEQREEPF